MYITRAEKEHLINELTKELNARMDGGRKNLIAPTCPYCGKTGGKFGIYIGVETDRKKLFVSHCFSCGKTVKNINELLIDIGREDLQLVETTDLNTPLEIHPAFMLDENGAEVDDSLEVCELPEGFKRCFKNRYLKKRGFNFDDFDQFPVGTTRGLNFQYDDYVIFPIIDEGVTVGFVGRHVWGKKEIDEHNKRAKRNGEYQLLRYKNSRINDFVKLLYNYDSIIEDETDTVIICEGVFDVIALTRKLELYDNKRVVAVATFGKKISDIQMFKLQNKGVRTVILGYDGDAVETTHQVATALNEYFDVLIAHIPNPDDDFDSMDFWDIYDTFSVNLKTIREHNFIMQT